MEKEGFVWVFGLFMTNCWLLLCVVVTVVVSAFVHIQCLPRLSSRDRLWLNGPTSYSVADEPIGPYNARHVLVCIVPVNETIDRYIRIPVGTPVARDSNCWRELRYDYAARLSYSRRGDRVEMNITYLNPDASIPLRLPYRRMWPLATITFYHERDRTAVLRTNGYIEHYATRLMRTRAEFRPHPAEEFAYTEQNPQPRVPPAPVCQLWNDYWRFVSHKWGR